MMPTPDIGYHRTTPPRTALSTSAVQHGAALGMTIGAQMWFDDDMVTALRGGAHRHGWTGTVDDRGRTVIQLDVMGATYRWVLTGVTTDHEAVPGRVLHEGVWPD